MIPLIELPLENIKQLYSVYLQASNRDNLRVIG